MNRVKDKSKVPPGGLVIYIDPDSGVRVSHPYYAQVYQMAKKHRIANNYPIGSNWDDQFEANVCANKPEMCQELGPDNKPTLGSQIVQFTKSMVTWVKEGMPVVSSEQFQARKEICLACPKWGGDGGSFYLGRCGVCGCSGIKLNLATEQCPLEKWTRV